MADEGRREPLIRSCEVYGSKGGDAMKKDANDALESVKRELRVMFSKNHQPIPLRIAKWAVILKVARRLYGTKWFWAWIFGLPLAGVTTHLLYRHKTRVWTRPWGGWRDVEVRSPK